MMEINHISINIILASLKSWMHITCLPPLFLENSMINIICTSLKMTTSTKKGKTFKPWKGGTGLQKDV